MECIEIDAMYAITIYMVIHPIGSTESHSITKRGPKPLKKVQHIQ